MIKQRQLSQRERMAYETIAKLEAKLAERDALLSRCLMSVREQHCDDNEAEFDLPSPLMTDIEASLSASAEPSAPVIHPINMKTMMQAYEQVDHKAMLHGTSNWCAAMATALRGTMHSEPSSPVERDERAEYDAWRTSTGGYVRPFNIQEWAGWMARAALERKP